MLRVAFLLHPTSPALYVVQAVAGDPCHCELLFSDGRSFTAAPGRGCAYGTLDPAGTWDVRELPQLDEARARAFCDGVVGLGYDWPAVFLWPVGLESRNRYMCAEIVAGGLVAAGAPPRLLGAAGDPASLNHAVRSYVVNASA